MTIFKINARVLCISINVLIIILINIVTSAVNSMYHVTVYFYLLKRNVELSVLLSVN